LILLMGNDLCDENGNYKGVTDDAIEAWTSLADELHVFSAPPVLACAPIDHRRFDMPLSYYGDMCQLYRCLPTGKCVVVPSDWFLHGLEPWIISYPKSEGVNKWHHGEPGSGAADDVHNYKLIHMWDTIYFRLRWISRTLAFGYAGQEWFRKTPTVPFPVVQGGEVMALPPAPEASGPIHAAEPQLPRAGIFMEPEDDSMGSEEEQQSGTTSGAGEAAGAPGWSGTASGADQPGALGPSDPFGRGGSTAVT